MTANKSFLSANPTWLTSPFFRSNNEDVIATLTGNNKKPTYTFIYSSAFQDNGNGLPALAYGIKNYQGTTVTRQVMTTWARSSTRSKKRD